MRADIRAPVSQLAFDCVFDATLLTFGLALVAENWRHHQDERRTAVTAADGGGNGATPS